MYVCMYVCIEVIGWFFSCVLLYWTTRYLVKTRDFCDVFFSHLFWCCYQIGSDFPYALFVSTMIFSRKRVIFQKNIFYKTISFSNVW